MTSKKDIVGLILAESQAYSDIQDIEKLLQRGSDLTVIPIQPLYLSLKSTSPDLVAEILPRLSPEQRQAMIDLDFWSKDEIDLPSFMEWPAIYLKTNDEETIREFVKSESFMLFLKARIAISTFSYEEPEYPDHDHYFLTDDNQFLVEYDDDFPFSEELQVLIRHLYADLGVEAAYHALFSMVSESFLTLQEQEYHAKTERLRDYGFVDYYEALDMDAAFSSIELLHGFLRRKTGRSAELDALARNQALHAKILVPYHNHLADMSAELQKLNDEKREAFLRFNFIRLVNATLVRSQALKEGSVAIARVGNVARSNLELGFDYVRDFLKREKKDLEQGLFSLFEFSDFYRIGNTLIRLGQNRIKKAMGQFGFTAESEPFLGKHWTFFLDNTFRDEPVYQHRSTEKAHAIDSLALYRDWSDEIDQLTAFLPYVTSFHESFNKLENDGLVHDHYFLNYKVNEIDVEAILTSSFMNFALGNYRDGQTGRMGLRTNEFMEFIHRFLKKREGEYTLRPADDSELAPLILDFISQFGLTAIPRFERYLYDRLDDGLSGYDYDELKDMEFKHVGGPILLRGELGH